MNVAIVGARFHIGQRVITVRGQGVVEHIDVHNDSVIYYVKLDNDKGTYIFESDSLIEIVKEVLSI